MYRVFTNETEKNAMDSWLNTDAGYPKIETKTDCAVSWIEHPDSGQFATLEDAQYYSHTAEVKVTASDRVEASTGIAKGETKTKQEMIDAGWDI